MQNDAMDDRDGVPAPPALPAEVWSAIAAYAASPATECEGGHASPVAALRCTSRAHRCALTAPAYHRARVADVRTALDARRGTRRRAGDGGDHPAAAAVGGPANLLKILVRFAPLEGWYTVADSWPWWLLIRAKFIGGKFCGDIVLASVNPDECRRLERVFELTFDERGEAQCTVTGKRAEAVEVLWKRGVQEEEEWRPLHDRAPPGNDAAFPHHNGLLLRLGDVRKDSNGAPDAWTRPIAGHSCFAASVGVPPPILSLIELLMERDMPLRRGRAAAVGDRYYRNDLVFEYLYAIQGRPLINGKEVMLEELVVGHGIKSF